MTSAKRQGTNFEYRVAYIFERFGYTWDRSGSSLGIDLKISRDGNPRYLVNCKKTSSIGPIYLPRLEVERLIASASRAGVRGIICFGFKRTPVLAVTLEQIRHLRATRLSYKLYPTDGHRLDELLSEAEA
ncbi:MAG: restriction endonuclease [Candidatus Hodarchaeaceae archaeon]|nr:restriction endonuclease [Candidatus Hodarchaeaceae archaeon]